MNRTVNRTLAFVATMTAWTFVFSSAVQSAPVHRATSAAHSVGLGKDTSGKLRFQKMGAALSLDLPPSPFPPCWFSPVCKVFPK